MRQGSNNRRSRGRNNGRRGGGVPNKNQTFESSGPESHIRIRGNATQVQEKYLSLARDALNSGDRILAENFFQHAEHYHRVMGTINEAHAQAMAEQQNGAQNRQPDAQDDGWSNGHARNGRGRPNGEQPIESNGPPSETGSSFAADPREATEASVNGSAAAEAPAEAAQASTDEGGEASAPIERQVRPRRRSSARNRRSSAQTEEAAAPAESE